MRLAVLAVVLTSCAAQDQVPANPPYRIGGGVTAPRIQSKVEPEYSEEARQGRFEGTVILFVVVDESGNPRDLKVLRPLGHGLDEKAIEAVRQWKFRPGMKNGNPVAVQATIEVNFRLYNGWRLAGISFQNPAGVSSPVLSHQKYPSAGSGGNSSASITLSFDINEQGIPTHLRVEKSSDPAREAEVLAAVEEWTFSPGLKNGQPVVVPCTVNFVLGDTAPRSSAESVRSKTVDPAKMAAIEEMFTVTKADQMIRQVLSQVEIGLRGQISKSVNDLIPPASDNQAKILADTQEFEKQIFAMVEDRIDFQKMKPELIKIYDETLTTEEITAALTFYKSPAGAAILQKLPTLTAKCVLLGQQMMRDAMPELQKMTKTWAESMKKKYSDQPVGN